MGDTAAVRALTGVSERNNSSSATTVIVGVLNLHFYVLLKKIEYIDKGEKARKYLSVNKAHFARNDLYIITSCARSLDLLQ